MQTNRTDQSSQIDGSQPTANDPTGATMTLPGGATHPESAPPLEIPPELASHPRYRIVELLGSGGMGAVYRAEHRLMQRTVALKIINSKLVASKSAVDRFRREVQAAARLDHPNIVRAYDAEQAGNVHFLVMEYANGVDLQKELDRRGPLPIREACDYIRQAAIGLQHAHENGMVHRDIKPHNLMVVSGRKVSGGAGGESFDTANDSPRTTNNEQRTTNQIKILDFGLASLTGETDLSDGTTVNNASGLTQAGAVMGTPDYMSPEQGRDARSADIRADIYSLGCTLYTALTGQVPFPGGSALEKVAAQIDRKPRSIMELRKDIPPALASVLECMMAKDPANRFQTPADVATALTPFAQAERERGPRRRLRIAVLAAAAALVLVFGVINVFAGKGRLKIESTVDDVQIVVTKDGEEIEVIDLKSGRMEWRLPSGDYEIKLKGERTDVKLDRTRFVIRRWNEEVVKVTAVPTVAEPSRDQDLLQGEWQPVRVEFNGQEVPPAFLKKQQFPVKYIFRGSQWGAIAPDGSRTASTLTLHPEKQPKWIDIDGSLFGELGKVHGIYQLDGDTVTVCTAAINQPRPTEFTTKGKPTQILIVAKRIPVKGAVARKRPTPTDEIAPKHRTAINKGLAYLAKVQHADGRWESNGGQYPVAMTALAGMAMLMEGSTIHDGDYANSLRKAVDWLMTQAQPSGLITEPKRKEENRYMFGHGFSLMFLATVYSQEDPGELRNKLHQVISKAIEFTERAKTRNGGWGYVTAEAGGQFDECATTIPQLQSLRAARNAGLNVSRKTLDAEYLRKFTGPNGGVVYSVTEAPSERPALTAAALAGCEFDSGLAAKWLAFCQKNIPLDGNRVGHDEYTHYYYAQALYVLGEKGYERLFPHSKPADRLTWSKYRASAFDFLVARQAADGSWEGKLVGPVYSTACYLTVLQLDNAAVPIYQR